MASLGCILPREPPDADVTRLWSFVASDLEILLPELIYLTLVNKDLEPNGASELK
jgi:hypothetical protein